MRSPKCWRALWAGPSSSPQSDHFHTAAYQISYTWRKDFPGTRHIIEFLSLIETFMIANAFKRHFTYIHTRIVVTMRVLLAMESVTFVDESLLFSVKLRPVWEFHTPICKEKKKSKLTRLTGHQRSKVAWVNLTWLVKTKKGKETRTRRHKKLQWKKNQRCWGGKKGRSITEMLNIYSHQYLKRIYLKGKRHKGQQVE